MSKTDSLLLWMLASSVYAFALFGWDKARSRSPRKMRIPEMHLLVASALGGWLGAFLGMLFFRHKTAKPTFIVKFSIAFLIWAGLLGYFFVAP